MSTGMEEASPKSVGESSKLGSLKQLLKTDAKVSVKDT